MADCCRYITLVVSQCAITVDDTSHILSINLPGAEDTSGSERRNTGTSVTTQSSEASAKSQTSMSVSEASSKASSSSKSTSSAESAESDASAKAAGERMGKRVRGRQAAKKK